MKRSALPRRSKPKGERLWTQGKVPGIDPAYKNWIRSLPCVICFNNWPMNGGIVLTECMPESRAISECAHVGVRGVGMKCSDRQTIPLCAIHHRTGATAHHVMGRNFWPYHSLDRDQLVRALQEMYPHV